MTRAPARTQSRNYAAPGEPRVGSPPAAAIAGAKAAELRKLSKFSQRVRFARGRFDDIRGRVPLMSRTAAMTGRNNEDDLGLNGCRR
jgi:hypothetical protein